MLCQVIPLEKFKPLFDSFQGDFKDEHRYFAGLYFVYRLIIRSMFAFSYYVTDFYAYLELAFVLILTLHGWIQPYKTNWHNKLDLYMLALMAIINGITMYNYIHSITRVHHTSTVVTFFSSIQVLLAYSPLVIMIIFAVNKLRKSLFVERVWRKLKKGNETDHASLSLSMLDEERHNSESSASYKRFPKDDEPK